RDWWVLGGGKRIRFGSQRDKPEPLGCRCSFLHQAWRTDCSCGRLKSATQRRSSHGTEARKGNEREDAAVCCETCRGTGQTAGAGGRTWDFGGAAHAGVGA